MVVSRRIPALSALAVFEAAGRHLSFTAAARELHVTQGAVSRQIRTLEQGLGVALFRRARRSVQFTAEGKRFHQAVTMALEHIADAVREAMAAGGHSGITIAATLAVSTLWLMPVMSKLRAELPDLEVQILASDADLDGIGQPFDVGIRYGSGTWPGFRSTLLGRGEVFPVCAPAYLEGRLPPGGAAALLGETLLKLEDERWDWIDWPVWFAELGIRGPCPPPALRVNSYPLLLQAARDGQGIALGWRYLVDGDLGNGTLVVPCDGRLVTAHGFHLVTPDRAPRHPKTAALCEWLANEFRHS
jgi:DNA-binding transcriptional LysR family regulator